MRNGFRISAVVSASVFVMLIAWMLVPSEPADAFTGGKKGTGMSGGFQGGDRKGMFGGGGGGGQEGDLGAGLDPEMRDAFMAMRATERAMTARGFFETGLRPVYPDGLQCGKADSLFGVTTRGDGSTRTRRFYQGHHGGLDIPAKGIDIVAVADGEVIEKSEGANIGGIRVILRHSPADTGLAKWTFTEYKHMKDPSPLALGQRVKIGTPVGIAWNSGTTGGPAYGDEGHYHLHMSAWYNDSGEYRVTPMMVIPSDGYWLDPLALMRGGPLASNEAKALADADKQVRIAYMSSDGRVHPAGAKVIWPFICR